MEGINKVIVIIVVFFVCFVFCLMEYIFAISVFPDIGIFVFELDFRF